MKIIKQTKIRHDIVSLKISVILGRKKMDFNADHYVQLWILDSNIINCSHSFGFKAVSVYAIQASEPSDITRDVLTADNQIVTLCFHYRRSLAAGSLNWFMICCIPFVLFPSIFIDCMPMSLFTYLLTHTT